jgi:hypothetical protein
MKRGDSSKFWGYVPHHSEMERAYTTSGRVDKNNVM